MCCEMSPLTCLFMESCVNNSTEYMLAMPSSLWGKLCILNSELFPFVKHPSNQMFEVCDEYFGRVNSVPELLFSCSCFPFADKVWVIDIYDAVLSCQRFIPGFKSVTWWLQGAEYVGTILQYTSKGGFRFWLFFKKKFIFFSWILYPFIHPYMFSLQNYKMVLLLKRLFSLKCKGLKDL